MKVENGITKNGDGTYDVRVATNIKGQFFQRQKRNVLTLGEARRLKTSFSEERAIWKDRMQSGVRTWREALDEYSKEAESNLRPSTFQNEMHSLNAHTKDWMDRHLDEFKKEDVLNHINQILQKRNFATKNSLAKFVRKVFQLQVETGVLSFNPASKIRFINAGLKNNKLICMTKTEVALLLEKSFQLDHPWHSIYRVKYHFGLRSGEAFALSWKNVDFENKIVYVSESYCFKSEKLGPPKNKESRTVPMSPGMEVFLKELKLSRGNEEFVLPHPPGWKHGDAAKILKSLQKDLGIRETNFHSLRASFITHLLLDGMPITKVQHMVGHKDLATTQRYVRLTASDLKGATNSLDVDVDSKMGKVVAFQPRPI